MLNLNLAFILTFSTFFLIYYTLFSQANRFSALKSLFSRYLIKLVDSKVAQVALATLFVALCFSNVLGNVPGNYTPTQYYRVVLRVRITF